MQMITTKAKVSYIPIIIFLFILSYDHVHPQYLEQWNDEQRALFQIHAVEVSVNFSEDIDFNIGDKGLFRSLIEIPLREAGILIYQQGALSAKSELSRQFNNTVEIRLDLNVLPISLKDGAKSGTMVYTLALKVYDIFELIRYADADSIKKSNSSPTVLRNIPWIDALIWEREHYGYCESKNAKSVLKESITELVTILRNEIEIANSDETMKLYKQHILWYDSLMKSIKK